VRAAHQAVSRFSSLILAVNTGGGLTEELRFSKQNEDELNKSTNRTRVGTLKSLEQEDEISTEVEQRDQVTQSHTHFTYPRKPCAANGRPLLTKSLDRTRLPLQTSPKDCF